MCYKSNKYVSNIIVVHLRYMKLCIFGADGRTGVEVVWYAKACGFEVVAFVYGDDSNSYFPSGVEIRKGNVLEYTAVLEAMRGTDAVISVLGHIKGSDPFMHTKGITNIVRAMQELGLKRVISLTGTGVRVLGDRISSPDRILNILVTLLNPEAMHDAVEHAKVLQQSGLDYTILRVLKLSKNQKEGTSYKLTDGGPVELLTSRKKVAKVLVDLVHDVEYVGKLPVISR